jgi:putative ABC transport system permease protein
MMFELACSILLTLALACCTVLMARPLFAGLLNITIGTPQLIQLFAACGAGVTALMLLAGLIPFLRLSRLAMQRLPERNTRSRPALRRMAITLQLAVSVVFLVAALAVMMQMRFINRKDRGFDHHGVIQLSGLLPNMQESVRAALIQELEAIPQITAITTGNFEPQHSARTEETVTVVEWPGKAPHEKPAFQMLEGTWPDKVGERRIVLNEEAVRVMGLSEPVGATVRMSIFMDDESYIEEYEVTGVVKDFHTLSLRSRIHPTIFRQSQGPADSRIRVVTDNILYIRTVPGQEWEAIRRITAILPGMDATMAGVRLTPIDELYDRLNQSEQAGLKMFSVLATVCLLIALFGIYAIATASTLRRRREIAIRKAVGAGVGDIVRLLFREYALPVLLAGLIALPPACYAMHRWLQGYAYRTTIPWWLPAGVITAVAATVLLTALGQTLKAARANPADVVKSE